MNMSLKFSVFPSTFHMVFLDFHKSGKKVVLHLSRSLSTASARTRKRLPFLAAAEPPELLSPFAHMCCNDHQDYLRFATVLLMPQGVHIKLSVL